MRRVIGAAAVLVLAIVAVMLLEGSYIEQMPFAEVEISSLAAIHEKQIDLFIQQSNLLTTLASALLAALGAFLLKADGPPIRGGEFALILLALISSGGSLYFGYLAYQEVIWMLHNNFFNVENPYVEWARRLQFFAFLIGAVVSLLFVAGRVGAGPTYRSGTTVPE